MSDRVSDPEEPRKPEEAISAASQFPECSTERQFRKLLAMLGGPQAKLLSTLGGRNISAQVFKALAAWKKDLMCYLESVALVRVIKDERSATVRKFKLDFTIIFWLICGDRLRETLTKVDTEKNWTIGKLFCHLLDEVQDVKLFEGDYGLSRFD
ncbi:hypothetical protein JCM5350_003197 [Sporobolomyces pararoseus]